MQTSDEHDLREIEHHIARHGGAARPAQPIGEVLSKLFARRGYAQVQATAELQTVWASVVGPSRAKYSRPGKLRRGVLQIVVQNSAVLQELVFEKSRLLGQVRVAVDEQIRDLRFRIGPVED